MNFYRLIGSWGLFVTLLSGIGVFAQQSGIAPVPMKAIAGKWALFSLEEGATPPPQPPPVQASYRPKTDAALASGPWVDFSAQEEILTGSAVFAEGIVLDEENRDVTGRAEVELEDIAFDGSHLTFRAHVGTETFVADLKLEKRRFVGTWTIEGTDRKGDLYLIKR